MAGAEGTAGAAGVVERPALYERLSRGSDGVTLVSARAGSGKSALLRGWVAHAGMARRTGWVSVERDERDGQHFWIAVVEELRNAIGDLGFVERLAPTPEFDGEQFVRRLLAELGSLEDGVVLVIDDLQELSSDDAHRQLELLLDRRPRWLRVVLASRHDPQVALHRLRLAGELTEIQGADLRFEFDEAKALLKLSGVVISDAAVSALVTRTEGWAAGLRLAALLLVNHPDPERRAAEFSGRERTISDYLLAEVLDRETPDARRLLLRTSIVDRVNGSLADRLTGSTGSERVLLDLERRNAFVESVDADHTWFRYPRLFGELLRLELRRSAPEELPDLQRVAAAWCDEHGLALEAIEHAQAAEDWPLAVRLLAGHAFSLALDGQTAALGTLLGAFPADPLSLPELAPALAYYELAQGSLDSAAAYVSLAERRSADVPAASRARFELSLAVARLDLARRRGDFSVVRQSVDALLALVTSGAIDDVSMGDDVRALGLMMLGITELWSFGFSDSEQHLMAALTLAMRAHRPYIEVVCRAHLALAALPRSAELTRERATSALAAAESHGWGSDPVTTNPATAIALAEVWQGRSGEAARWLERADESVRADVDPITAMFVRFTRGMQLIAAGRLERAVSELESAHALQAALVAPQALAVPIVDYLVLTLVRVGRLDQARELITRWPSTDPHDDALAISTAAVALASSNAQESLDIVAPVLGNAARALWKQRLVTAFVIAANAHERLGDRSSTIMSIERALDFAEPDALVFPFEVVPCRELLAAHPQHETAHASFLTDVLDVLAGSSLPARAPHGAELVEPLSESELKILRYLPSNLSATEIGGERYVSTSTVKTHMRNIYSKLGVHRRTDAVDRARELGLLAPLAGSRRHA